MKKSRMVLLGVLSAFCVTGCGEDSGKKDDTKKNPTPVDSNFTLTNPEDTSQLSENCKAYVDAMRAQEEENGDDVKYMMTGYAFQPKDEVKIGAKDSEGKYIYRDQVDYNDEDKKEEQQSQKSDKSKGVALKFATKDGFTADSYKIKVSTDKDFKNDVIEVVATPDKEVKVKNLFQSTKYYWKVVAGETESLVQEFETGNYPRWIDAADMFNVRDAGGYMTSSGKRVKQGLIYRGGEITLGAYEIASYASSTKHQYTGTDASKDVFRNVMKIGNELDLRRDGDLTADTKNGRYNRCYFAEKVDGVDDIKWTNVQLSSWEDFLKNNDNIKACFEAFAHADEAPVYYHCHGGADRTGTLGLFLLGVLGVSYSDIVIDFELTSYSSIIAPTKNDEADSLRRHYENGTYDHWAGFIPNLIKEPGWDVTKPLQENLETYLVNKVGVPSETIQRLKDVMLED